MEPYSGVRPCEAYESMWPRNVTTRALQAGRQATLYGRDRNKEDPPGAQAEP